MPDTNHCRVERMFCCLAIALQTVLAVPAAAQEVDAAAAAAGDETNPFALPAGNAGELLQFIEQVAKSRPDGRTPEERQVHVDRASQAIVGAADKVLAGNPTDLQAVEAMEWKVEALNVRGTVLDDRNAMDATMDFLASFRDDPRPAIVSAARRIELFRQLRRLPALEADERKAIVDDLVVYLQAAEIEPLHIGMLMQFGDTLADTEESKLAAEAFERLLPTLRRAQDPQVRKELPMIEGIARRLNLPGNEIELEGTLLDGTPLDWEAYRGKVVLVDFWATWCGPCINEVPNVVANYQAYHEKGFDVLGISLDGNLDQIRNYMDRMQLPWATLVSDGADASGWEHPMAARYGVTGIPRAILVDQNGIVIDMNARGPRLGRALRRLLGAPEPNQTGDASDPAEDTPRTAQNASAAP